MNRMSREYPTPQTEINVYNYLINNCGKNKIYTGSFTGMAKEVGISKQLCRQKILSLIKKGKITRLKGLQVIGE